MNKQAARCKEAGYCACDVGHCRISELESALKVIHTWASVEGALDPDDVRNLCNKALGRAEK